MNPLGIVLVMGFLAMMVIVGAVIVVVSLQRLRARVAAGLNTTRQMLALSVRCCPLALGLLFVLWGIASITKIVGIGEMAVGTTQAIISIMAQTIPVVIIFLGAYMLISHLHKSLKAKNF